MTKFILLAIISAIHGGICADTSPPPYLETHREIINVVHAIQDNVLSMADEGIPFLNDSRRHYLEIVHVVYVSAFETAQSCPSPDDNKIIERAAVEALSDPEMVVKQAKKVYNDLDAQTSELHKLIKSVIAIGLKDEPSDALIDLFVKSAPEKYEKEVKLHFATGKTAKKFNEKNDLFNKVSKELLAHKFVVTKFETLKDLILALTEVIHLMHPRRQC